jgi:hypothetical protein
LLQCSILNVILETFVNIWRHCDHILGCHDWEVGATGI